MLASGVFAWSRPGRLRWVNLTAFVLAGAILVGVTMVTNEGDVGALVLLAWIGILALWLVPAGLRWVGADSLVLGARQPTL